MNEEEKADLADSKTCELLNEFLVCEDALVRAEKELKNATAAINQLPDGYYVIDSKTMIKLGRVHLKEFAEREITKIPINLAMINY